MAQNGADYTEIWVRQGAYPRLEKITCTAWKGEKRSPRVQLEGLAKRASLRTIPDWIVLEYLLSEASLPINQPNMGQNGADYSEIWVRQGAYPRLEKCLMYGLER